MFTLFNTIEIIFKCFDIPHFEVLLLSVVITLHRRSEIVPEVGVVKWLWTSLTDVAPNHMTDANFLSNHLILYKEN